ncbi:MAG: ligand-gated channel protein [Caldimonas sp.]|uniref:TonB-dependent siderophore receptor n=1 Tax=Caldimonas taiwanensis TaxID=307483 RepID=UPI0007844338|nr:TonB-dependent receptor [Caldimonas taiwanensis]GIX23578.1 MAG: ligand-gated channel protein [Caldimonas sp.]
MHLRVGLVGGLAALLCAPWVAAQTPSTPLSEAALPAIEVTGRGDSQYDRAEDADATKTELPVHEQPQAVRVVTRQTIEDLRATRLDDVLDHVGGVSRQNGFGGLWDNIAIRGLAGHENTGMSMMLNGFSANRGFNAPRDLAGVDRIEFLKGPVAALYGSSEPGGTLNTVSKRPLWSSAHSLDLSVGSHDRKRVALDTSAPWNERMAYRLNLAAEDHGGFRNHVDTRRYVVAPAFTWKLSTDTVFDYVGEFLQHATPLDRGVVAVGNRLGVVPRSRFLGEPADGDVTVKNQTHQVIVSHDWGASWRSRLGVSYRITSLEGFSTEATALQPDQRTLTRQRRYRDYDSEDVAMQAELQGRVRLGGLEHELLLGVERYRFRLDSRMLRINPSAGSPYAIDIYDPVYGQPQPVPLPNTDTVERQRNTATYVQDMVRLTPQWRLMAGVRLDHYDQTLDNRRTGRRSTQSPQATSPRVGLSWLPTAQWALYANAGRSFRPNVANEAGEAFDPEKGQAVELGSKWESVDQRLGATAAVFDIRKRNVVTSLGGVAVAAGRVRSQGVEFDLTGRISPRWRVNASLSYTEATVTEDGTLEIGGRLLNVPRVTASLLAVYEGTLAQGQRYSLGGGVTHVGKRLGQARTQSEANAGTPAFELPAYTLAKLVAHWQPDPMLRLALDVDNLFDRTFYSSSYSRVWVTPGAPRTVTVSVRASF